MKTIIIEEGESGQRFDKFLRKYLREAGSGFIYKMLRKKNITLNGRKASGSETLGAGDTVRFFLSDETILRFRGTSPLRTGSALRAAGMPEVLYRDGDILIFNKPAGMLVQPSPGGPPSIADALPGWLLARGWIRGEDLRAFRPAPANRIDRNTSGLVLCGVSLKGLQMLSGALRERSLEKHYLTLAKLPAPPDGMYRAYIRRDGLFSETADSAREDASLMETGLRLIAEGEQLALIRVSLITGRTHQIRAHLSHLGSPVAGDRKYGDAACNLFLEKRYQVRRQLLHAHTVSFPEDFPHAELAARTVEAPLPEDFLAVMKGEGIV